MTGFVFCFFSLGVSGRWKQMVQSLLLSRPAPHLCHSLLRRTGNSPTPLMCSFHPQASCQAPTLTCLVSASLQASWEGYERCLEGLDRNSVPASSKGGHVVTAQRVIHVPSLYRKKHKTYILYIQYSAVIQDYHKSKHNVLWATEG